jgi:hypothetical protein
MSAISGPNVIEDGLVLALDAANVKSYPGTGTAWTDLSNNGNNGTLVNGPTFNSDNLGSLVFDGTNTRVTVVHNELLNPGFLTLEAWIYPQLGMTSWATVCAKVIGNSAAGYSLERRSNTSDFSFWVNHWNSYFVLAPMVFDVWQYIVGTYDGTSVRIYKNSIEINNRDHTLPISHGTENLFIGKHGNLNYYWKGGISNIRIHNRALTSQEILQNYNATKGRFGL